MDNNTPSDFPCHFFEQPTKILLCLLLALLGAIAVGTAQKGQH